MNLSCSIINGVRTYTYSLDGVTHTFQVIEDNNQWMIVMDNSNIGSYDNRSTAREEAINYIQGLD